MQDFKINIKIYQLTQLIGERSTNKNLSRWNKATIKECKGAIEYLQQEVNEYLADRGYLADMGYVKETDNLIIEILQYYISEKRRKIIDNL